jgi:hypothetical protein
MLEITTLTAAPKQRHQLVLDNNETVDFKLYYLSRQESWYYDFVYKDLTVNGSKVVLTPNSLRAFKRLIPFGLAFIADGNIEPFQIDDFESGRVKMYVLNESDVQEIEQEIFNQ